MEEALCLIEQRFPSRREVEPEEGGFPAGFSMLKPREQALGGGD
jgi:hypothetical protein